MALSRRMACNIYSTMLRSKRRDILQTLDHIIANNNSTAPCSDAGYPSPIKGIYQTAISRVRSIYTQHPRPYVDPNISYTYMPSNHHLFYSTLTQLLDEKAKNRPDDVAYISHYEKKIITFAQLREDVNRVAKALKMKFGIQKDDVVGLFVYNCYQFIVVNYACLRVGATLSPINPSNKSSELKYILEQAKIKCLFLPGPKSPQVELNPHYEILNSPEIIEASQSGKLFLKNVVLMEEEEDYDTSSIGFQLHDCQLHNWRSTQTDGRIFDSISLAQEAGLSESEACIVDPRSLSPDDLFAIYFTSGTTGNPKGACCSQFSALNNAKIVQRRVKQGHPESWKSVVITPLPMYHVFAGILLNLAPLVDNGKIVYSSFKYDIAAMVEATYEHGANTAVITPTMLIDLLAYVEAHKLHDIPIKLVQSGGAALSPEIVARAYKIIHGLEEIRMGYGSTENASVATYQDMHEPAETLAYTVGPPMDFSEIRVVDPETGMVVKHGEKGEIQTRGHNTMIEYLNNPEKTSEALTKARWYRTGDIGFMHPHGSIQISARIKHMILKGGENIYPEEVEKLIYQLDYVESNYVIGIPDKRLGEQVCAWIKLKSGYVGIDGPPSGKENEISKQQILDYCKERITYFKVPKYILYVDDFPMTPTKKVKTHEMVKKTCEILGIENKTGK